MNDNLTPALERVLKPIPHEVIGAAGRRACERDRDNAAIELAAYVIGILKFSPSDLAYHRDELLKRANKVRRSQGNGAVTFVAETAEAVRAAVEPRTEPETTFEDLEARMALLLSEPVA